MTVVPQSTLREDMSPASILESATSIPPDQVRAPLWVEATRTGSAVYRPNAIDGAPATTRLPFACSESCLRPDSRAPVEGNAPIAQGYEPVPGDDQVIE